MTIRPTITDLQLGEGVRKRLSSPPSFKNAFAEGLDPRYVGGQEAGEQFKNVGTSVTQITVRPEDDIQAALDKLNVVGGGRVQLKNGTYTVASNLTLYSNITIEGSNVGSSIIDFNNNSAGLVVKGSDAYNTGTVTISNNGTTVTGSGTSWSSNVSAGQHILLGAIWYPITAVVSDTELTIGLPYAGFDLSGDTYVVATKIKNVRILQLTVKNSASIAIDAQYTDEFYMDDIAIETSAKGLKVQDSSNHTFFNTNVTACNSGMDYDNVHLFEVNAIGVVGSLVGDGADFNGCTNGAVTTSFFLNNAGDGLRFTDCESLQIAVAAHENAGQGIELVSGNSNISFMPGTIKSNGSDGIKLTATSDECVFQGLFIKNNGGYGWNVAASTCDDNILHGCILSGNTTAETNDSGTGTLIRSNKGVVDN